MIPRRISQLTRIALFFTAIFVRQLPAVATLDYVPGNAIVGMKGTGTRADLPAAACGLPRAPRTAADGADYLS